MDREPGGWHALTVAAPAGTRYQFVMPDGLHVPDPASRMQDKDVHGPSRRRRSRPSSSGRTTTGRAGPGTRRWSTSCMPAPWAASAASRTTCRSCSASAITAIEIMPIADFPGRHNWGYDGVLPYAPDRAYGTPDELKSLIDAAHGLGLNVILDVVYNHFGPDGAYIHAYAKPFFREDIKTPWGAAIDFRRPEVRDYFIQNAVYWLRGVPVRRAALRRGARDLGRGLPVRPRPHHPRPGRARAAYRPGAGAREQPLPPARRPAAVRRAMGGRLPPLPARAADRRAARAITPASRTRPTSSAGSSPRASPIRARRRRAATSRAASRAATCRPPPSSCACRTTTRSATAPWASG